MRLFAVTLFLSGVFTAPLSNELNKRSKVNCNKDVSHFHTKKTLLYSYEGETVSGLIGTSDERSGLRLRAKCQITAVLPCTYMLQIIEAELLDGQGKNTDALDFKLSPGSKDLSRELKAREVYFETHDGSITNIQSLEGEPERILNMKRGILSAFQLKITDNDQTLSEVDVNGKCNAFYHIKSRHDSGRAKTVVKTKNFTSCEDRSETNLGIPVTHYPTDKPFSLLKSESVCKYVLSPRQRFGKIVCEETHLFRPFSSGYNSSSGAMTIVRQSLSLIGHVVNSGLQPNLPKTINSSLKYVHIKDPEIASKNYKDASAILDKLGNEEGAKPDTAGLFTKLIFALRRLNTKGLKYVWIKHYKCQDRGCSKDTNERYKKFIVDALSQCGTLDCAQFMVSVITDNEVGTPQSVQLLTGIALVGKPSEDMVGNILYFCQETPSRTAFLTLGTLIHKYCSQHSCDNLNSRSPIYQADKFLEERLGDNCQETATQELENITLSLKAIGNAGRPSTSVPTILKCAAKTNSSSYVNIDAIQSLRRFPCSHKITNGLMYIFDDLAMDTEIRIESYLALMRCPNEKLIKKIADILNEEKNNQVASFVSSHLTNALQSSEPVYGVPLRDLITRALNGTKLPTFDLDFLRYSHAYDISFYNRKYEFGGSSQAQMIFHQDSYFPRSAKFNLTVDMLGASVNLIETAARFEGFEGLIEQMFGPDGHFPDERLMELLNIKTNEFPSRSKRSTNDNEMSEIKSNLLTLQNKMKIERKSPTGAISLKVFGHELQFLSFEDIDWLQGEADSINVIDTLINIARGGSITYTKSFMLLEAVHEIPTALGIPLKLAVNGSSVASVTLNGKFDIRNMFWGKKKLDVRGVVSPSATVYISANMMVDATHSSSGIQVNASLFTSTEINGNATYKEGEGIKLSVEPPSTPVYIVNVKSNLATFLNEKRQKISGSPRRFEHKSCVDFSRFLGVSLCGDVSLPLAYRDYDAPYFPLTGDTSFGMVFNTTNANLARFEVETRTLTDENENSYNWMFSVHVPGLTFGRKVVGNSTFQFLNDGQYLGVTCGIHDYKFGKFEAKYNNVTNRLQTKFSTPTMSYLRPITIETEVFNTKNNETNAQDIGIAINARYNNLTITDVISFHKHNDRYGIKSKFTYWPMKHILTEAQFSLLKKSLHVKIDDSNNNKLFFASKLGKSVSRFYVKIGNNLTKKEIKINGELNTKKKVVLVDMISKPSWHVVKFEAYPRWNALENGFHVRLSHLNSSSYINGYLGSSNPKRESIFKLNGEFMKKPFLLRASHFVLANGKKVEWVVEGFENKANATVEYSARRWSKNNLEISAALNNNYMKTGVFTKSKGIGAYFNDEKVELDADYTNEEKRKGFTLSLKKYKQPENQKKLQFSCEMIRFANKTTLNLNLTGPEFKSQLAVSPYYHETEAGLSIKANHNNSSLTFDAGIFNFKSEKGFQLRARILERDLSARWTVVTGNSAGLKFSGTFMNKSIELMSTYSNVDNGKLWLVKGIFDNKELSLATFYDSNKNFIKMKLKGLTKDHLSARLHLTNHTEESFLHLMIEAYRRTASIKAGWKNNSTAKGIVFQTNYNRRQVSDVFVGVVTSPSYYGLRFRGIVNGKNIEALFKYTERKRSLGLDLTIQRKVVTFESMFVRESALKGVQINMFSQNKKMGSVFALLHRKSSSHTLKFGAKVLQYSAEYRLSLTNSRLEKKLTSMVVIAVHSRHYRYGYSLSYINKGVNGDSNHIVTTKLHYSKNKFLTTIYQFANSDDKLVMWSKMELAPGQFIHNKIAYNKPSRNLVIKYEMLPGINVMYEATFINNHQALGLLSNLTIFDYPISSSAMFEKQSGLYSCQLNYGTSRAPIQVSGHLRHNNGIDFTSTLSLLDYIWNNTFFIDFASKQLQLNINVLPYVPIKVFANMMNERQFVFNITTCSAFSVELVGITSTADEYNLILKHKYYEAIFEDLKLTISSFKHLNKLRLRLESEVARNMLRTLSVQNLVNGINSLKKSALEIANDSISYMKTDGHDTILKLLNVSHKKLLRLHKMLRDIDVNNTIYEFSTSLDLLGKKLATDLLYVMNKTRMHDNLLFQTYKNIVEILKDITADLFPYTTLFPNDLMKFSSRTIERYLNISIGGITINKLHKAVSVNAKTAYEITMANIVKQVQMILAKCQHTKVKVENIKTYIYQAIEFVEAFTCNFDINCTKVNLEKCTKLAEHYLRVNQKKLLQTWNVVNASVLFKLNQLKNQVEQLVKENQLDVKITRILQPILVLVNDYSDFINNANIFTLKMNHVSNVVKNVTINYLANFHQLKNLYDQLQNLSMNELVLLAEDQLKTNVEKMKNRFIKFQVVAVDFMSSHFDSIVNGVWNCTYDDLVNTTLINAQHFIKWIEKKIEKVILTIYLVPYFAKCDKFELYEFVTTNIYQNALKFYTTTKLYCAVAISLSYSTIENSVETLKRKFLVLRDGHLSNVTMTKLNEIREVSINMTLDLLKKLTEDASLLVSNLKTETMKVQEKLYNNLQTFIFKYRTMLLKTLQSSQTEILNTINLYKDIPIEEIYRNMQTKGSEALNNIFGVVTNETLTLYQSAMMKSIEILEIYERNKLVIEEKMKMFKTLVQNLTTQYGYLATESYEKISLFYHNHIQTLTSAHASNMKNLMVSLSEQYEHFKIWFEHVKPMKLKELYNIMKIYFENSNLSIKACCAKKFKVLLDEIESLRMKFYNFINETANESINVLEKIRQVNEEVKKDFITTLTPYEKIARYVYNKQRRNALKNIALIVKKYDEVYTKCRNITEMMANQSQHVIVNTILSSVKQNPLLIQVAKLYKTISEFQLLSTIVETLNKVRTHETWTAIEKEIMHHEAVFVSKVLGKSFLRKLKEVHVLSQSVLTLRNIRNISHNGFQYLQTVTMTEIENITTAIMVKSHELYLNLRNTFDKLMSKSNDFYVKKNKLFLGMFERLGEISILEIEQKLHQHIRNLQAPLQHMYKNLSIFVVNEVMILDNHIRKLLKGFEIVKKHLASFNTNIKNHYEDIYMTVNQWGKRVLNIVSFDFAKFGYRPTELVELLNFHVKQGWVLGKRFVNEYVSIYNLTKLTPNELLHIFKVLPNKFEQVLHTTRKCFDRCIIMLKEVKESVNDKKMTELREKAESIMNNTRDQMHFFATETLETIVFVTKFYGSVDTVYSANPELVQLANFHVQRIINSTQVCKAAALNLYTKISENVARFLNQTSSMYHNDLPRLVKYIRMEWYDLDAAGKLKKIENVMSISMLIGSNLIKDIYTEARISFDHHKDKLINYVNVKNSEVLTKLNETKTWLMQHLGSNIEKMTTKVYKELWYRYNCTVLNVFEVKNQLKMIIRNYIEHLSKLPESAKISFRQWQLMFDNIRKDLNTLINDSAVKLHNGGLYVRDKVPPLVKENCMSYINKLKNKLSFLSKKTEDAVKLIISDIQEDLPIFKKKIVDIFYIVRASEIAFISGDLELNIEQLVELRTILTDLYNLTAKKCGVFHARLYNLYQSCVTCCVKIISWALDQCNMTTRQLYQHISINLKPKLGEIRKSIVTKLTTFSKSIDGTFAEITRMQQKLVDMCHEKAKIVYNKSVELRQITFENIRIILKQLKVLADDLQKRADLIKLQTKLRMEQFERNIYRTDKNFTEIMNENRDVIQEKITDIIRSLDMRSFLNQYVDIEDLNNKTIEIGEDVMNIRMVKDVVDFSKACYSEGQRLLKLSHETSEFVMYLIKRIVKYSDVWEIVETLTDPFHWIPPSDSVAMIFGKPHVYTFDGHSYQFIGYKKPSCTYVLAHDFRDNNFTLMSQETALIINTKSGYVKIHANGKVDATVSKDVDGNDVKTSHYELPVEMQDLSVRREGSYVKIHHDTGVDIACDVKHFLCTFNINKFYHGRLAGLLGTNNNEQYDEFLKPDKTIAKSVAEFANAWEVSGDRECKVSSSERKPTCKTQPSPKCKDLFLSSTSPLAKYFKSLDPAPFYKACQYDTSDCQSVPSDLSFCNVTAAYTTLLRKKGIWASQLQECANCGSKDVWVKWTERGNDNVDIVLMIPDTLKMKNHTVQLSGFLKELENELRSNYTSRYAVVAFGGKTAFLQRPHIVTNGGKIFGGIKNVESTIASMQFNGKGANALEAVEYLAQLPFKPGASKVVIMLSTQSRAMMTKAPLLKAKKELNMQGIIFNVIGPYFKRSEHKDVLGLWKGKAMVKKSLFHSKEKTIGLPANDHIRLAESTKGGVFNLKAYSQVHGNWLRSLKRAMKTTIVKQIQEDQTYCRQCVCVPGLTVEPLTICRTNRHSRCT